MKLRCPRTGPRLCLRPVYVAYAPLNARSCEFRVLWVTLWASASSTRVQRVGDVGAPAHPPARAPRGPGCGGGLLGERCN